MFSFKANQRLLIALLVALLFVASKATTDEEPALRNRELTNYKCSITSCYFKDFNRGKTFNIPFGKTLTYYPDSRRSGYSILCKVNGSYIERVVFKSSGYEKAEYQAPYWMGANNAKGPFPVPFLKQCGYKKITVKAFIKNRLCDTKYLELRAECKKNNNNCNYQCPRYSSKKQNRECYDNIHDCQCYHGFVLRKKKFNRYVCECPHGYYLNGGKCIRYKKQCNYKCPSYSRKIRGRSCYDTFDDCECYKGYKKLRNRCVRY